MSTGLDVPRPARPVRARGAVARGRGPPAPRSPVNVRRPRANARTAFLRAHRCRVVRCDMAERDAKARLYEAALQLMGRNGIAATSTREILAAAGSRTRPPSRTTSAPRPGWSTSWPGDGRGQLPDPRAADAPRRVGRRRRPRPSGSSRWSTRRSSWSPPSGVACWRACGGSSTATCGRNRSSTSSPATARSPSEWRDVVALVFPHFPPQIGVARNVTVLRTVGWMLARMADDQPRRGSVRRAHPRAVPALVGRDRRDAAERADEPDRRGPGAPASA